MSIQLITSVTIFNILIHFYDPVVLAPQSVPHRMGVLCSCDWRIRHFGIFIFLQADPTFNVLPTQPSSHPCSPMLDRPTLRMETTSHRQSLSANLFPLGEVATKKMFEGLHLGR